MWYLLYALWSLRLQPKTKENKFDFNIVSYQINFGTTEEAEHIEMNLTVDIRRLKL